MTETTYWYRVEETTYSAGVDEWGDPLPGGPTRPNLICCKVEKVTACGAWVLDRNGWPKFVNLSWGKRYALPTVGEAIVSFKARKQRQIRIAQADIKRAEEVLERLDKEGFYNDGRKWLGINTKVPA